MRSKCTHASERSRSAQPDGLPNWLSPRRRHPSGFTLIELVAVLVLIALLAVLVGVSLRRTSSLPNIMADIVAMDALARAQARQSGISGAMEINLQEGTFHRAGAGTLKLPREYSVRSVRRVEGRVALGSTRIRYSERGQSPAYAILLRGPGNERLWVVFPGFTRTSLKVEADHEVEQIFSALSAGSDAG